MAFSVRQLQQFLSRLEPTIARAFQQAVAQVKSQARIAELEAAIRANDAEAAFRAAGFRPGSWTSVTEALRTAYIEGGQFAVAAHVPARFRQQFNPMNPRALEWVSAHSADLVTELNIRQRHAIRTMMTLGAEAGRNPRSVALDIVGRVGRTGRRQGGVIGLHEQFADFAANARRDLETLSPDYFTRTRRDRRYDATVRRAIEEGRQLPRATIDALVGRYEDRLLQTRGNNIARTEIITAYEAASDEAMRQVVEEGLAEADAVESVWDATLDSRTRPDHAAAHGQRRKLGEPFSIAGYPAQYPGDPSLPASQRINCRCFARREIDFSRTAL